MDHTEWEQGSSLLLDLVVCKKKKKKIRILDAFGLVTMENQRNFLLHRMKKGFTKK